MVNCNFDKILQEALKVGNGFVDDIKNIKRSAPANLLKTEDGYALEVLVPGFAIEDIDVRIEDGKLVIEGMKAESGERDAVWKTFTIPPFQNSYLLTDRLVVEGANLVNGVLTITVKEIVPETLKPREIKIGTEVPAKVEPKPAEPEKHDTI